MSSGTWTAFHSRGEILRAVAAAADARLDGQLPLDVEGVERAFDDELDLLGALQLKWHTRLAGRIDRALMSQPMDLEGAVVGAWQETAEELPGVRRMLDHHHEQPLDDRMAAALDTATAKEHAMLAVMAGRAGTESTGAAAVGAVIEGRARATRRPAGRPAAAGSQAHRAPGFIDRLRAALAA